MKKLGASIGFQLIDIFKQHKFEYVYNIAGIAPLPDCQTNPTEAVDVNVNGFVNILELFLKV